MERSDAAGRGRKGWTPGVVIACAVIAVLATCLAVAMPIIAVNELWGVSLLERVGTARPRPVWMAWVVLLIGLLVGVAVAGTSIRYLYHVARGREPRRSR